jgi:hypothetical protein
MQVVAGLLAAPTSLSQVINNLTAVVVGLLVAISTLFLTVGGVRYMAAGGDPVQVQRAKEALKAAGAGYVLAAIAPLLVQTLSQVVS